MEAELHNTSETRVFHVGVAQDWIEWFCPGYNWRNFTLLQAEFELDHLLGGFEVKVGAAGFRAWFNTYDCGPGSKIEELNNMKDDWMERADPATEREQDDASG